MVKKNTCVPQKQGSQILIDMSYIADFNVS